MALWGSSVNGVPPSAMHDLILSAAHAQGRLPHGSSLGVRLYSYSLGSFADPLVAYTGHAVYQWAVAAWDSFPSALILGVTMDAAIEKRASVRHPSSPADVACLTVDRIGWKF